MVSKQLLISFLSISFILGLGAGYVLTPEYSQAMADRKAGMVSLGSPDRYFDQRYLDGMIAHHLNAIYMSDQAAQNSNRKEVKDLAQTIISVDKKSIEELYQYKKTWYGNTRPVTRFEKINLGDSDEKFDLRYLNALVGHHDEAIDIAKEVRTKTKRTEVLNLADSVITNLSQSKTDLLKLRQSWYGY